MNFKKFIISIAFYVIAIIILGYYISSELTSNFIMSEFGRLLILFIICLSLYLGGYFLSKYIKNNCPMKINLWIFLILYLILFITLTLLDPIWGRNGLKLTKWSKDIFNNYIHNSLNLVPFKTIILYIKSLFSMTLNTNILIYNLLGNFICLMPLSFFLTLIFKKNRKASSFLFIALIFTILIELLQFLTLSGSCDIDDIILNVLGAFIMFKILHIKTINNLFRNIFLLEKNKIDIKILTIFIMIVFITVSILIIGINYRNEIFKQELDKYLVKNIE